MVQPLFESLDFNLVVSSVIQGNTPAWVFADDPHSPRCALIWDRQDAILVAGEAGESMHTSVRDVIFQLIVPNGRERGLPLFSLSTAPNWEPAVPALFAELSPERAGRYSYRFTPLQEPPKYGNRPALPGGFRLRRIDENLLNSRLAHLDEMQGWIDSFWETPEKFLDIGYGYCMMYSNAIASWCLTVFAAGTSRELGVATAPKFRRSGLATHVAAACLEHGLANKQEIHWHCFADNHPSARIALGLGFQLEREYAVYRLKP